MFSIVIPLYNEEKNITSLLEEIFLVLNNQEKYEIILINDLDDLNEIPKGPTKKILYRELRNYYNKKFSI